MGNVTDAFIIDASLALAMTDAWFAEAIVATRLRLGRAILVGLAGSQGSGKSTTAARLVVRLRGLGLCASICALDDFYLKRADRAALAREVHPLLGTRGVPGTHDVEFLTRVIEELLAANDDAKIWIPHFNKATDDRAPHAEWALHQGRTDVVLLEGWCVGARPQTAAELATPVNSLERDEDGAGVWRRYFNARLADDYADLFDRIDLMLMLRAPSFDCVLGWRAEQESRLSRVGEGVLQPMNERALARFISHYERITKNLLAREPANLIADLDVQRRPVQWRCQT